MRYADRRATSGYRLAGSLAVVTTLALGCSGKVMEPGDSTGGGGSSGNPLCADSPTVAPQRLVRLTLNQTANAVNVLLGATAEAGVITALDLANVTNDFFPPLNSPREGVSIIPGLYQKIDTANTTAAKYVLDNFAAVTGCAATDDACVQTFLLGFAEKAYRRPLDDREKMSLTQVYTEVKAAGGTAQEGAQYGVDSVLSAAEFLYRTEFGDATKKTADGFPLTPYEAASQISFFIVDGPPDQPLLDAAKQNKLGTPDQIGAQVDRLLGSAPAQANLSSAMFTFFKLHLLDNVVIDPMKVPTTVFNTGVLNAMFTEGQKFLDNALWKGVVNDLVTSTTTFVNSDLAANIYGIPVPAGATQTNFVQVDLPADKRAGMLTLSPFITSRARTDVGSVVARGLVVDETMLCQVIPGPPDTLSTQIAAAKAMLANQTSQQAAMYRATTSPCNGCHVNFDPYGLVLENYDVVGRYRTMDEQGRPVDSNTTLPASLGGGPVANAVDMAQKLAASGGFARCMAKSLMQYALSDTTSAPVDVGSCAVDTVAAAFQKGSSKTFPALVRQVAVSKTIALRKGGN